LGSKIVSSKDYEKFIQHLDERLKRYFKEQEQYICCKEGCSLCCERGDYPLTEPELHYLMQGYISLDNNTKRLVQDNFKQMKKGEACPFLINKKCSVYKHRPIVCRVHGLAYREKPHLIKLPHCAELGMNFKGVYVNGEFLATPANENLDTIPLVEIFDYGDMRNLYDWIKNM